MRAAATALLLAALLAPPAGLGTAHAAEGSEVEPVRILPVGDSITHGYNGSTYRVPLWELLRGGPCPVDLVGEYDGLPEADAGAAIDTEHQGKSGIRADGIAQRAEVIARGQGPDVALLLAGINDLIQRQSAESTLADLEDVIVGLRRGRPGIDVVLGLLTENDIPWADQLVPSMNAALRQLAARLDTPDARVVVADLATGFDHPTMTVDGLHPDAEGARHLAERWAAALGQVLPRCDAAPLPPPVDPAPAPVELAPTGVLTGQVSRLYEAYFERPPDEAGLVHWRRELASGTSLAAVSAGFAGSAEFLERYGRLDDAGFVRLVYRNVLGRDPDRQGYDHWTSMLAQGLSRGAVMVGFSESPELVAATQTAPPMGSVEAAVRRLYRAVFLRPADAAGLAHWTAQHAAGLPLASVASAFTASDEFRSRYGGVDDATFVDLLYRNVLGRSPDAAGAVHWRSLLGAGLPRGDLVVHFSESTEHLLLTDTPR